MCRYLYHNKHTTTQQKTIHYIMITKSHSYHLFKGSRKWVCPNCGRKTFVPYVDSGNNVLDASVGKCDRADKCGYHKPPREYFAERGEMGVKPFRKAKPTYTPAPPPTFFNDKDFITTHGDIFKRSVEATQNHSNNLITFLNGVFGVELVSKMVADYYIGTSKHWENSTVFWQIDRFGRVHGGKIMQYNPNNGKRVKKPSNRITWVHSAMKLSGFNLSQCLFGEHLLKRHPNMAVAIVESEKTATIASGIFADCITLACGGCGNLTAKICQPLRGRDVVLFPDNGKFTEWRDKGQQMRNVFASLRIADIMEREATSEGDDIGDLILERYHTWDGIVNIDLGLSEL